MINSWICTVLFLHDWTFIWANLRNEWEHEGESMTEAVRGICIQLSRLRPRGEALLRVKLWTSTGMHLPCLRRPSRKGRCSGFFAAGPGSGDERHSWSFGSRRTTQLKLRESPMHCGRTEGCVVQVQQFLSRVSYMGRRFVTHSWSSRVPVRRVDHGILGCERTQEMEDWREKN